MSRGKTGPKPIPLHVRHSKLVAVRGEDECWLWQGGTTKSGYGKLGSGGRGGKTLGAHVIALTAVLPRPESLYALHTCDTKLCCNPKHLYWGTQTDNMQDAVARGQHFTPFRRTP
jgi:hypothetical protein